MIYCRGAVRRSPLQYRQKGFIMKKIIVCAALALSLIIAMLSVSGCGLVSGLLGSVGTGGVKITKTEAARVKYEKFDNGYVSLEIPKGWIVDVSDVSYSSYSFKVVNPQDPDYVLFFCLKLTGFLKTEEARAAFARLYPSSVFGMLSAIDPQTTEGFFKVWNENAKLANEIQMKRVYFPYMQDFTVIENLGKLPLGGDVLRASYKNDKGEPQQGLFTTSVFSSGSYYMYGYDFAPLNAYHNVFMMAPDDEFNNWLGVYDHCIGTIRFSEKFYKAWAREEETMVSAVTANAAIYDEVSDLIMDSWEKRNDSYDIISQKQSDATLGYERVYDTQTGEVYRAYNGFTDNYSGDRYKAVTDDMYKETISGYIGR